jgi:hypothetical protein
MPSIDNMIKIKSVLAKLIKSTKINKKIWDKNPRTWEHSQNKEFKT